MNLLTTKEIYIAYIIKNYRDKINEHLSTFYNYELNGRKYGSNFKKKCKFVRKLKNPRYVNEMGELFSDISYTKFREIIKYMNMKVMDQISDGRSFEMGEALGNIFTKRFESTNLDEKKVSKNWGKTRKLKQEIIDRGETPLVNYKNDQGEIIGDNGGVPYFVYFTDLFIIRYKWWRYKRANENFKTGFKYGLMKIMRYYFKPTKENRLLLSSKTRAEEQELELTL